jgi:protein-disulfide isomerase
MRRAAAAGIACTLLTCFAAAQDKTASPSGEPLAVLDGQPVYEDQLPASEVAQLQRMMVQVNAVKMRGLHETLDQKLIEAEAKKKGVSKDDLFKAEVLSKVPDPTDEQVKAGYEARQDLKTKSFDDVKDGVKRDLKNMAIQKAEGVYVQGLWQQALNDGELSILVTPPKLEVKADMSRLKGDPKAPIAIVEFSDFSCPFCRKAEASIAEVLAKYPGQVKLAYEDFPLRELHPNAQMAAEASRCAGEQGQYWEYHDLLFARQDKQSREGLMEDARALKLDEAKFDTCLSSGRYRPQIDQDILMGSRAGMVATPGFFINGTFVSGAQPPEVFAKIIDRQLSALNEKRAAN